SNSGYGVNCSTTDSSWRHVQNRMIASIEGHQYVIACVASVRWSKCHSLNMGTYRGRHSKHGIEIIFFDEKNKQHSATFAIIGGTANSPTVASNGTDTRCLCPQRRDSPNLVNARAAPPGAGV